MAIRLIPGLLALLLGLPTPAAAQVVIDPPIPPCPWWNCGGEADVVIEDYRIDVAIEDGIAVTRVTQVVRNDSDFVGEGEFLHPIPADAAVTGLTLWIDGEPVEGELLDTEAARRTYEEIVRNTLDPALLEYAGDGLLRVSVFPIGPHDTRTVEIEYSQVLPADSGLTRYRHPFGREHNATIDAVEAHIEIRSADGVKTVYSPSHVVGVNRITDNHVEVGYEASDAPESDLILYFSTDAEPVSLQVLTYAEDGSGYFLLLASPGLSADETVVPKDVVIVLDVSGSMEGQKFEQAQGAAEYILAHLNPADRFDVIAFSTGTDSFGDGLRPATEAAAADEWVRGLAAGGSTNIDLALNDAFDRAETGRPTYVVFLTDGLPTEGVVDTPEILDNLEASETVSVFAFGVGFDVDTFLLDAIARDHHGTTTYVSPGEAIDAAVEVLYAKVASPVLTGVALDFDGVTVSDLQPNELPDVFRGGQLVVAGRYEGIRFRNDHVVGQGAWRVDRVRLRRCPIHRVRRRVQHSTTVGYPQDRRTPDDNPARRTRRRDDRPDRSTLHSLGSRHSVHLIPGHGGCSARRRCHRGDLALGRRFRRGHNAARVRRNCLRGSRGRRRPRRCRDQDPPPTPSTAIWFALEEVARSCSAMGGGWIPRSNQLRKRCGWRSALPTTSPWPPLIRRLRQPWQWQPISRSSTVELSTRSWPRMERQIHCPRPVDHHHPCGNHRRIQPRSTG